MPWILVNNTDPEVRADLRYPRDFKAPRRFTFPFTFVDEGMWPLVYEQSDEVGLEIPDWTIGESSPEVVISLALRRLIEAWEPDACARGEFQFVPMKIKRPDGSVLEGTHFVFKWQSYIDRAIIVEESHVSAGEPSFVGSLTANSIRPLITWDADAIKGRHIWSDPELKRTLAVSDEFYAQMKQRKMAGFIALEGLSKSRKDRQAG